MGAEDTAFRVERPRDPGHGDLASNIALVLASRLRRPPREIAEELVRRIRATDGVDQVEVAGAGFLNFRLGGAAAIRTVQEALASGSRYGRSDQGEGRRIMVEFVSANPTGPLHLGHGRQAALGDAIANLLEWTGWQVHREFYFNDAGRQMERLAASVRARYQQALGRDAELPGDGYQGEYVAEIAEAFRAEAGDRWADDDSTDALDEMRRFAVALLRREQEAHLAAFGVRFDEFYSETSLYDDGRVEATARALDDTGLTYRKDGAVWLRTTRFGDQKDRVMVKSDGSPTYFLPDVAYHMSKWDRGFHDVVNVQGSDHHSTVDRVRAGLQALGRPAGYPEYILHQMVTVERHGEEVRFSKRAGSYTTLDELIGETGADVARYFFLMRRPEAHLTFDLDVALDQSDKNPVYKIQYAHARLCTIFVRAAERGWGSVDFADSLAVAGVRDGDTLDDPAEQELAGQLGEFPGVVARAASARAPHVLCDYMEKTAGLVNSWYHAGNPSRNPERAVLVDDPEVRRPRLALAGAARIVLRNGLSALGLSAPERMDRSAEPDHAVPDSAGSG